VIGIEIASDNGSTVFWINVVVVNGMYLNVDEPLVLNIVSYVNMKVYVDVGFIFL
jgi:hypothetical protein